MHHVVHEQHLVLTASQMRAAEQRAVLGGISGWQMMQRAGQLVAQEIIARFRPRATLVLCGPGNNGGDGFVVAEALRQHGWPVEVASVVPPAQLRADALTAAQHYRGEIVPLTAESIRPDILLVDALYGTGLERSLDGEVRHLLSQADALECTVVAVDIPSGIHADSGRVLGAVAHAVLTVTFAARKPAHLLYPGKEYVGEIVVADIGIAAQLRALERTAPPLTPLIHENTPDIWHYSLRFPQPQTHKYQRGSAIIAGGGIACTGAARLAAIAALRAGAGVVAVVCDTVSLPVYAAHLTSAMTKCCEDAQAFGALLADVRHRAVLIGPGHGVGERTCGYVQAVLATGKPCVLDADALTSFASNASALFAQCHAQVVMTPHEGEFAMLFSGLEGDKLARARAAAEASKAVIVLKGADTVIACADGRVAINSVGTPDLATAGSGDVLSGIITGLLATGMPVFEAACAGVWIHGAAAERLGLGLIAEDLPHAIPEILKLLRGL